MITRAGFSERIVEMKLSPFVGIVTIDQNVISKKMISKDATALQKLRGVRFDDFGEYIFTGDVNYVSNTKRTSPYK
jgi:hypothetical protein